MIAALPAYAASTQTYRRLDEHRFDYTSEGGVFHAVLTYDERRG